MLRWAVGSSAAAAVVAPVRVGSYASDHSEALLDRLIPELSRLLGQEGRACARQHHLRDIRRYRAYSVSSDARSHPSVGCGIVGDAERFHASVHDFGRRADGFIRELRQLRPFVK